LEYEHLKELINDIDMYISQHAIYINKLEKSLRKGDKISTVDCNSCKFGKDFNSKILPHINDYDEDIKNLLKEIEDIHCKFHDYLIDFYNLSDEDKKKALEKAEDLSTKLFTKLLKLKNLIKES